MMTVLWLIVALIVAVAIWVATVVNGINERFDQIEHKLDVVIDQLEHMRSTSSADVSTHS
jgi:hypothetical protein